MPQTVRPPFRADHIGSFLRPEPLRAAMERSLNGEGEPAALKALQDASIREIVAFQEGLGLALATDGEYRHASFHNFLEKVDGVTVGRGIPKPGTPKQKFEPRTYFVQGKLRHTRGIEVEAFKFLKSVTRVTPKVTMASPTMLLRAGRDQVSIDAYADMESFYADIPGLYQAEIGALADAGSRYVQLDDTNFGYLCDPELSARRELGGGTARSLSQRYAKLINAAISKRPADMAVGIHICRGNSAGQFAANGGYEPIAEILLNELNVDGYFLEYDDTRSGGFEPLQFFPKGSHKKVVLGLVSTKNAVIESKDALKRRIDEAARQMPLDNLCLSPQCGFASTYKGNPIAADIQKRKMELIVETAREVWGGAR